MAAGSMRTSLPWCFGSARPSFERSFAGSAGRRANGRSETSFLGSSESNVWQYGLLAAGPIRTSLPWCFGSARPSLERSFAGSAGRRANGRSETSF